jgi:hypothetical protein
MNRFFLLLLFVAASTQAHTRDTSIRVTNWANYFVHSPDFAVDTSVFDSAWGQYYNIKADTLSEEGASSGGYPSFDYISYGDIDGDDREEALIFFYTGGSAGACSYAVIRQTEQGLTFVDWGGGFKLGGTIFNDTLQIFQPVYVGWEPNCCPSSMEIQYYRVKQNKLVLTDTTREGIIEAASFAVEEYYNRLSSRNFADAYDLLGDDYQTAHPFQKWLAGFKNTISVDAAVDTMKLSDSTVHLKLTTVDSTANNTNITSTFEGTWKMQWYDADDGWILTEPKIIKINKK